MEAIEKKELGGGLFIIDNNHKKSIFTPEDFSEEQQMMKAAVRDFIDREVWPNKERFEKKDYELTKTLMEKAGSLGFLSISVPEAYGGMGMDFVSSMLVCDYISGATGSLSTAFGAHTGIGTLPITLYGTEEQKQKYLPKLSSGEWFGCYCLTEPGAGSDANSGKTKAELTEDGTHYKISGQKMWISNAGFASLMIVFARIENDKNITAFLVDYDSKNGIRLGDEENKLGIHSSSTRQVFFTETIVPMQNMLGERGGGFKIAMNALNVGRVKLGVACLDAQRRITTESIKYANERVQFKTPISKFGAIKEKIARMATSCYVGESACYRVAKDIEDRIKYFVSQGMSDQEAELKGVEDYAVECSLIKVGASEDLQNCSDEGIQIFGGMGFSADTPMESAWRDARIGRIYEGTNEINRMLSVGMLLKKGIKGHIDLMGAVMKAAGNLSDQDHENNYVEGHFSQEQNLIYKFKQLFLVLIGNAVQKYGKKLEEQQQILLALSDILIEIYFAESALLRTIKNLERGEIEAQEITKAIVQFYVFEAHDIVNKKGKEVILNISEGKEQKQLLEALNKNCSYREYPNIIEIKTKIADKFVKENRYFI
ncbi:MAG: acyl-CoA dehydrogenase [Flavobacteriaceae bacterium]|nr:acyl-CoA dehydrogenase [Flavobacteriaceae bacterium]